MQVQVLLLGRLQDVAGRGSVTADIGRGGTVETLIESFDSALAANLTSDRVRVALNGALTTRDAILSEGDEVAFLPPVSGG